MKIAIVNDITCPAMGDNICGPNIRDNIPEIYTFYPLKEVELWLKRFQVNIALQVMKEIKNAKKHLCQVDNGLYIL